MPCTGYDDDAMRIGSVRSDTRSRRVKLGLLAAFAASLMVGGLLAAMLR